MVLLIPKNCTIYFIVKKNFPRKDKDGYKIKQIAKALGSYAANLTKDVSNNNNTCTFVELQKMPTTKVKATTNKPNTSQVCYTLQHQNGAKLTIETPDYSEQQLATIIKEFVCCN